MAKMLFKPRKISKDFFQKENGINFIYKLFITEENIVKLGIAMEYLVKYVPLAILTEKNL